MTKKNGSRIIDDSSKGSSGAVLVPWTTPKTPLTHRVDISTRTSTSTPPLLWAVQVFSSTVPLEEKVFNGDEFVRERKIRACNASRAFTNTCYNYYIAEGWGEVVVVVIRKIGRVCELTFWGPSFLYRLRGSSSTPLTHTLLHIWIPDGELKMQGDDLGSKWCRIPDICATGVPNISFTIHMKGLIFYCLMLTLGPAPPSF